MEQLVYLFWGLVATVILGLMLLGWLVIQAVVTHSIIMGLLAAIVFLLIARPTCAVFRLIP